MKQLTDYIEEKLLINKNYSYKIVPKSFNELKNIINERTKENHKALYLSDIDVSNVKEFVDSSGFSIFGECYANELEYINVTGWDVSHITNFSELFAWFSHLKEIKGIEDWEISPDAITQRMFHCVPNNVIPEWYKNVTNNLFNIIKDMKTLMQHISERLIINKNFKNIINDWTNVKDIFSITFNNTLETVYLDVSCIKNEKEIEKITDTEFCFNSAQTLTNSTRSGNFKISNDKNFAYYITDTSRYYPFRFSEFIIHPSNANKFKELCNKIKSGKKYDYDYIISTFGLSKNDFPDNFFEHKSYTFDKSKNDIDKFIEYIDKNNL